MWGRSKRQVPPGVAADAAANPGGWVYEIDGTQIDDPDGYVPPEAIVGGWKVGLDGKATGEYKANPDHGPVKDDLSAMTRGDHFWGWLPETPEKFVQDQLIEMVTAQVPGSVVEWIKIPEEPRLLTGALPRQDDPTKAVLTRTAFAAPFVMRVRKRDQRTETLSGVLSWAAANLHQPELRRDRLWFDLWTTLDAAGDLLEQRIYSLDAES